MSIDPDEIMRRHLDEQGETGLKDLSRHFASMFDGLMDAGVPAKYASIIVAGFAEGIAKSIMPATQQRKGGGKRSK